MAHQSVFCNSPWYETHIYWNGDLGICCQESRKIYKDGVYNIRNMTLAEWFNSQPVKDFRLGMLSNQRSELCSRCWDEETVGFTSRRHRSNQKSVIFTRSAFDQSYLESPGYQHFKYTQDNAGLTDTLPIDLHVDLGNFCNLACKMCYTGASSKIAVQMVKWGYTEHQQYVNTDWTKDEEVWTRFLNELVDIPNLKNIHFMGGETLINPRFEQLVDFMTAKNRFDICFSFVTNGTKYDPVLMEKLSRFSRVGIEISIESTTKHNDYIRQGGDTKLVIANIEKFLQLCDNNKITVTLRPTLTALSIGSYHTLLEYCLDHKLLIKSLLVHDKPNLAVDLLPSAVKQQYLIPYVELNEKLSNYQLEGDFNESDPNNYLLSIKIAVTQAISLLENETTEDAELLGKFVDTCKRWDQVYGFDAIALYPELAEIFIRYGYTENV
jgi:sulfatase maturation enzyme AslB (radical SAM superfamily)